MPEASDRTSVRLDRWLWAASFFKTRSLAKAAVEGGKVHIEGQRGKPAKLIQVGTRIRVNRGPYEQEVVVAGLAEHRGPASVAETLYAETEQSVDARARQQAERKMARAGLQVPKQKPTKRQRRERLHLRTSTDPQWHEQLAPGTPEEPHQ